MEEKTVFVVGDDGRKPPSVVGYLKKNVRPRDEQEASPEAGMKHNREVWGVWVDEGGAGLRDVLAELAEVELGMGRVAALLRFAQPGREGRLTIRWWKMRGDNEWREPVLLRVSKNSKGAESYKPVDQRARAKSEGAWGMNSEQVAVALRAWWPMVKRRGVLLERLRAVRREIGRKERPDVGDWRYALASVEVGIEVACRKVAESRLKGEVD